MKNPAIVLVLDINGILADIRRKEEPPIINRKPDALLPNGQKAYLHPHYKEFIKWLHSIPMTTVVTYTSRLRKNAEPVEALFDQVVGPSWTVARLYGENCKPAGSNASDPLHPVKTLTAVIDALKPQIPPNVIFIDDNPERIENRGAPVYRAMPYDAKYADSANNLTRTAHIIREMTERAIKKCLQC